MAGELFQRILVPTDFSVGAEEAWGLACRLAATVGSEVVLAHVFVEPAVYGDPAVPAPAVMEVLEESRQWVGSELEKWAASARGQGLVVRTVVRTGAAATQIVDLASDERADLIVMGTHGRGGLSRMLLGSVAERVVRTAPCPLLTVRKPE